MPVFPAADDPNVRYFDLSPDGTLLAFTDVEPVTNRLNIFVTTWPDMRERQQVTTEGGVWPRFSTDSRRVFYRSGGRADQYGCHSRRAQGRGHHDERRCQPGHRSS